jgi:putative glutamine amidotransferase
MVGVQWHPEVFDCEDPHTRELFRGFVEAADHHGQSGHGSR